jgi:hypothetical protein
MAWSETAFRARLKARAAELGQPYRVLLAAAGIGHDTIDKEPASGRRIDTLEKIAVAFRWSLAEVMGINALGRIDLQLLKEAFASAKRVLGHLPRSAQTDEHLVAAQAYIYDALAARQRDGREMDNATLKATLTAYEEILIRAWEGEGPPIEGLPKAL